MPIFSGYAAPAVAARLNDAEAKLLITADGLSGAEAVPMKETADAAVELSPCIRRCSWSGASRMIGRRPAGRKARPCGGDELAAVGNRTFETPETDPETRT